jgi:hypothetical protein
VKVRRFATQLVYFLVGVLVLAGFWPADTLALRDHTQTLKSQHHDSLPDHNQAGAVVKPVRESMERFRDVSQPN